MGQPISDFVDYTELVKQLFFNFGIYYESGIFKKWVIDLDPTKPILTAFNEYILYCSKELEKINVDSICEDIIKNNNCPPYINDENTNEDFLIDFYWNCGYRDGNIFDKVLPVYKELYINDDIEDEDLIQKMVINFFVKNNVITKEKICKKLKELDYECYCNDCSKYHDEDINNFSS